MNKRTLLAIVSVIATLFATTIATSACFWYIYQPEEPKCLKDM
jgi:cyclic lactone autoinducer peptide